MRPRDGGGSPEAERRGQEPALLGRALSWAVAQRNSNNLAKLARATGSGAGAGERRAPYGMMYRTCKAYYYKAHSEWMSLLSSPVVYLQGPSLSLPIMTCHALLC